MLHSKSYQLSGHNLTLIHLPFHYMPFQTYHFTTCCSNHTISPHTVPIIPFHHIPFQSYHFTTCCSNHTISLHAVPIISFCFRQKKSSRSCQDPVKAPPKPTEISECPAKPNQNLANNLRRPWQSPKDFRRPWQKPPKLYSTASSGVSPLCKVLIFCAMLILVTPLLEYLSLLWGTLRKSELPVAG